ncbi:MAG: NACHT domain-containing protein, partial [Anaerolineales bacterium]|nr:NACHT domain-containing protein [Anaerolineales bacterium]
MARLQRESQVESPQLLLSASEPEKKGEEPVADAEWERRYLYHLLALCGHPPSMALVDIKEAGLGGAKLALDSIFTSLDVRAAMPDELAGRDEVSMATERRKREPVLAALSRETNRRLVILGAPGSGKSTLVNFLTLCLAGDRLAGRHGTQVAATQDKLREQGWELGPQRLWPVRVILREYAASGLSQRQTLWQFIAADLARPDVELAPYAPILKEHLQLHGGILLLDGLDEVDKSGTLRDALKRNIGLFARDFPKVRLVVTSRPYAYGSGWDLSEFQFQVTALEPFSDEQIAFFIDQWYAVMGQHDITLGSERAQTFAASLQRQIERHRNLQEMAQHPLLLTMMVYIHRGREGGALPQRREELYRLCVVLLLDLWRRSKVISGRETETLADLLGMNTERLQKALAEVAFVAHRDQPEQHKTGDIPGMLLAGILHKHKSKASRVDMDEIIEYVRDRAGLLEDHGRNADDSDDVYRFPHRTFQEYLAAMHMLEAADFPDQMVKLARQDPDRWREAVLLAMSAAKPDMQWAAVEALYGHRPVPQPATG